MALVNISGLSVSFAERKILDGIDLCLERGDRVCIVGANGSGKSSLGQAVAGWLSHGPHLLGDILTDGQPIAEIPVAERATLVQYVGQVPMHQLSGRAFTVAEEVAFGPENLNWPIADIETRVADVLKRLDLAHLDERDPFTLSGGEQQRLSIASAIALSPALLILDEAEANLDVGARQRLVSELAAQPADSALLILDVEPDLGLALGCRMLALENGRLSDWSPQARRLADREERAIHAAPTAAPILDVRDVAFGYPELPRLYERLSLSVAAGEAVALVGPNGVGKSTLFRLINGLSRSASGSIRIGDRSTAKLRIDEIASLVATVFQEPENQLFSPTVREEVAFGLDGLGLKPVDIASRIAEVLERVGLSDVANRHPLDLDTASRRFVTIACALARRPALLLLDEAQRGLDRTNVARIERIIAEERARGASVLFICHDPAFTASNATRIIDLSASPRAEAA
ncbi:ABC transporter ATP-binding protein [Pleomorphomonas sp. PLEO]|uniref:ABC transporter ATP-binding protein n=1 Tax=Pleomorphomonas sp. PLEO TaxID=3239306 RepID=UPI00351EBD95